jgi:hypothetical protein
MCLQYVCTYVLYTLYFILFIFYTGCVKYDDTMHLSQCLGMWNVYECLCVFAGNSLLGNSPGGSMKGCLSQALVSCGLAQSWLGSYVLLMKQDLMLLDSCRLNPEYGSLGLVHKVLTILSPKFL